MNLQCPNCQKLLTVQEHYAGQLMKCPLCKENFTVPALPAAGGTEPAPGTTVPAFTPLPPAPASPLPSTPEAYGLKAEPPPTPAWSAPTPADSPAFSPVGASPALLTPPTPPPTPAWAPSDPVATPSRPVGPSQAPPAGYTQTASLVFSDRVLQWFPPVAVVLIFILTFFTWVGVYPGDVPALTQSGWGAGFSSYSYDRNLKDFYPLLSEDDAKKQGKPSTEPGISLLTLFYLFPFFIVTLVVTVGVVVLPFVHTTLPAQVHQVLPWKWAIVAGLNAICLLFLLMQLLVNFDVENRARAFIKERTAVKKDADAKEAVVAEVHRGEMLDWLQRTVWLRLVVALHIVAMLAAAMVYWIEKRGPMHPLPRLQLQW